MLTAARPHRDDAVAALVQGTGRRRCQARWLQYEQWPVEARASTYDGVDQGDGSGDGSDKIGRCTRFVALAEVHPFPPVNYTYSVVKGSKLRALSAAYTQYQCVHSPVFIPPIYYCSLLPPPFSSFLLGGIPAIYCLIANVSAARTWVRNFSDGSLALCTDKRFKPKFCNVDNLFVIISQRVWLVLGWLRRRCWDGSGYRGYDLEA
eukprot:4996881-Pleurochrysis_carterae.AAC.2